MKHDCRTITGEGLCEHLYIWRAQELDNAEICSCKALNVPLFPLFENYGYIKQKLIQVKPLFECPYMQELRKQDKSTHFILSI